MKNYFLFPLSLLLLTTTVTLAQRRFSVGVTAAPVLAHSHSNYTFAFPGQAGAGPDFREFDIRTTAGGATIGAAVEYAFNQHWSINTGSFYHQLRYKEPYFTANPSSTRVTTSGWQIPLAVTYRSSTKRLSPYFSVGAVGFLPGVTVFKSLDSPNIPTSRIRFERPINVQALVGAGIAYQLTDRWLLSVQPTLLWHFRPKDDTFIQYNQFTAYQIQGQVRLMRTL